MALSSAKHEKFYETSGSGADKVSSKDLTNVTAAWAVEKAEGCSKYIGDPILGPIVFQLQQMQDELDYLRAEIDSNKDKVSLAGGSATTLSFGEMITTPPSKKGGSSTYHIIMTAAKDGVSKTVTLTLT